MPDNTRGGSQDAGNPLVASDEVTYSGDTADVQLLRPVHVTGSEGAKTTVPITDAEGVLVHTPDRVATGTIDADEETVAIDTAGMGSVSIFLEADTFSGNLNVEGTSNGSDWFPLYAASYTGGGWVANVLIGHAAGDLLLVDCAGLAQVRIRASTFTSGSITLRLTASRARFGQYSGSTTTIISQDTGIGAAVSSGNLHVTGPVLGDVAHGSPDSGAPVKIGGFGKDDFPPGVSQDDRVNAWFTTSGELHTTIGYSVATGGDTNASIMMPAGHDGAGAPMATAVHIFNGTTWDRLRGDITNGLDVDVTRLPALPAGNNNIGDVDIASIAAGDNNIGNVDVVTLPALPAGTNNIGDVDVLTLPGAQTEDGGLGATPVGHLAMARRDDSLATLSPVEDDAVGLRVNNRGALWMVPARSDGTPATGAEGILVDINGQAGGPVHVDDNAGSLTVDAADGTFFVRSAASSTFPVQIPATAANPTKAEDSASANLDAGMAALAVRKATPANTSDTDGDYEFLQMSAGRLWASATIDAAIPAGTNNIGDVDVLTLPALPAGTNNIGDVDVLTMPNVTLAAGTNTNEVVGDIAHDTGVGGNPLQIAAEAKDMDDTAPPNVVNAESDVTRLASDRDGVLFVHPHGPRLWSAHFASTSAVQTDASVHAAPASGLSLYVTDIVFSIGVATASSIFFEEGSTTVLGPYYLEAVAGRGLTLHFMTPKKITAATALTVTNTGATTYAIDVMGYTAQG